MPGFNFKERFVQYVKEGSKRHTIRPFRPHPIKPGQLAHLFTGMRTRWCTRLVDPAPPIVDVKSIAIHTNYSHYNPECPEGRLVLFDKNFLDKDELLALLAGQISLPGVPSRELTHDERNEFAYNDGFRFDSPHIQPWNAMKSWWGQNYPGQVWVGQVIYW